MSVKRQPVIDGGICKIPLTRGYFSIIDLEDLPKLAPYGNWHAAKNCNKLYAQSSKKKHGKSTIFFIHRVVLGVLQNKEAIVDHIDGDGLNNCKSNLRLCTSSQNAANSPYRGRTRASKYKGVRFRKGKASPWQAEIKHNYKTIFIGGFKTEEQAALAYNRVALELHGDFAYLNEVAA